jgi:hypothetical protein
MSTGALSSSGRGNAYSEKAESADDEEKQVDRPTVFDGVEARPFDPWEENRPLPCVEPEPNWARMQREKSTTGFIFAKPYKTGSSTASGVNLRIARNVARRMSSADDKSSAVNNSNSTAAGEWEICKSRSDHVPVHSAYKGRDRDRSYLWTILRDPTSRVVSQFFHFEVSRKKLEPTDANFVKYVRNGGLLTHDYYYFALSLRDYVKDTDDRRKLGNQIILDFDFIGTTERMDESIVVMSMLLGIPVSDVMYLKAKGHGGYDDGGGRPEMGKICTYIWPSFKSTGMTQFLESEEWKNISYWDRVLYDAADRSLDLTIDRLGRDKVAANVALFKNLQERAHATCLETTTFPCSEGGAYSRETDCLWNDSGCGCACLDEVAAATEGL